MEAVGWFGLGAAVATLTIYGIRFYLFVRRLKRYGLGPFGR